jgi:ATP-dependent DNA helicase RecG
MTSDSIEGKTLLVLKVYKGDYTPYLLNQKAYKRIDTSTIEVDRHGYEALVLQGRNLSFEELNCAHQNLEFEIFEKKLKNTLKVRALSNDLLITLGLKKNGNYTNAAGLLSDHNPVEFSDLQLIAYETISVREIKDRLALNTQSVLEQYDHCLNFYHKHINSGEVIEGAYRQSIEEVPLVAFREAVADAILHRDYSRPGDVRIEIYQDRIEVTSPGGLPIGISEEEYIEGRISVPRNRILAEIFYRLKIIEKLATGVRRIKEYYQDYKVKPEFHISENSIQVILPKISRSVEQDGDSALQLLGLLNEQERKLYGYIQKTGSITRIDAENFLGLKKSQTFEVIKQLKKLRLIVQTGNARTTKYKVI